MIDYNIEQFFFLFDLYEELYDWLATRTPLNHAYKTTFKFYNDRIWKKLNDKIEELEIKESLNDLEKDFLKCKYKGKAYRIINYSNRKKGHIYPIEFCQSCSKTLKGINKVKNCGEVLLIELKAELKAIDVFELLMFMYANGLINDKNEGEYRSFQNLKRYLNEEEIVMPMNKENILDVSVYDLYNNKVICKINRENWFRNNM